jgi:hypothetical protein
MDRTKHLLPLAGATGLRPNRMAGSRRRTLQNARAARSSTRPQPSRRGAARYAYGATAPPWPSAANSTQGLCFSAWRTDDLLVLLPSNPLPLARSRAACPPSRATDDPTAAALPRDRFRTQRDTLQPLQPQSPTRRALDPLVAPRRRVVGEQGRRPHRLPSTLKNSCPQVRHWLQDKDPRLFCDGLGRWPPRTAAQRARRSMLARFLRDHHVRSAAGMAQHLHASQSATPVTTAEGVIAPKALLGQARGHPLRVT